MSPRPILLVDDNLALAENLAEILAEGGFATEVYARPREALESVSPGRYALALLDLRMPGMDGVELYRAIKHRDPALPAIAMSAYAQDARLRAVMEEGVLAVFPKPLEIAQLLARLSVTIRGELALVVEDDVSVAENLAEALAERGFAVRLARTCEAARRLRAACAPSVCLVDCSLPDGDGIDLVSELCPPGARCSALVFSGHPRALSDAPARASALGLQFFEKPLDLQKLLEVLRGR